jgi:L-asparaginase
MAKTAKGSIHLIMTGGTIDSHYDANKDTVVPNKKSILPDYVKGLKLYEKTEFTEICMKDSRNLTQKDLKNILSAVQKNHSKKIIITHGTYTMPDTARYLKHNLKRNDKTIIFTGSMLPLSFTNSDAPFNLGYSIAKLDELGGASTFA